jgi:hypothetical protein
MWGNGIWLIINLNVNVQNVISVISMKMTIKTTFTDHIHISLLNHNNTLEYDNE